MAPPQYEGLVDRVDRVVHAAATTRMNLPLADARRVNVDGTATVLQFCRALRARGRSGRLDYVGTAYVAGDRRGLAYEDELDVGQEFRNSYEQSKCEAEALCRRASADLPITIYRPSIIVGDSGTGETTDYKGLYILLAQFVRFYDRWRSVLPRFVPLPLNPSCSLDLVPVDWVAHAIIELAERRDAPGRCYHLAAGPEATTIERIVGLTCAHFDVPHPRYVSGRVLASLARVRRVRGGGGHSASGRWLPRIAPLLPYVLQNPRFDVTNTRGAGLRAPVADEYFPRVLSHAYAANFGRDRSRKDIRAGGRVAGSSRWGHALLR
jgi:nucleoside-diphosphate-sugar epimerase